MIDKTVPSVDAAVRDIHDGATVLVGGFGDSGSPVALLEALTARGAKGLTIVSNNAGTGLTGLGGLIRSGAVAKIVCSFPKSSGSIAFDEAYAAGQLELELVPQGTLTERIRAGGAGIAAFYTPTGVDTLLTEGREVREFDGRRFVLERAIKADFALIRADRADRWGNLIYRKAARNFGPTMAMAARTAIAEVREIVPLGQLDPEQVVTPGVFVQRVVEVVVP